MNRLILFRPNSLYEQIRHSMQNKCMALPHKSYPCRFIIQT